MKMIGLLQRISTGNRPNSILYKNKIYLWDKNIANYVLKDDKNVSINWDYVSMFGLNEEVEIIKEDKKIDRLEDIPSDITVINAILDKLNEIIDEINEMREDK